MRDGSHESAPASQLPTSHEWLSVQPSSTTFSRKGHQIGSPQKILTGIQLNLSSDFFKVSTGVIADNSINQSFEGRLDAGWSQGSNAVIYENTCLTVWVVFSFRDWEWSGWKEIIIGPLCQPCLWLPIDPISPVSGRLSYRRGDTPYSGVVKFASEDTTYS